MLVLKRDKKLIQQTLKVVAEKYMPTASCFEEDSLTDGGIALELDWLHVSTSSVNKIINDQVPPQKLRLLVRYSAYPG